MKDYYTILEVTPNASQEKIREQYYLLIQAWHPDKFTNPTQKAKAEEKSKDINAAYEILKNSQKRAKYDREFTRQQIHSKDEQKRQQAEQTQRRANYERQRREQQERAEEERRRAVAERQKREKTEREKRRNEYKQAKENRNFQQPIRVLIVDDTKETRTNIRKLVGRARDIEIVGEASNGADAIEKFTALLPDVVTMDINMPIMDGITATKKICQQHPAARVIILSIQDSNTYKAQSVIAGAYGYLILPPAEDELLSTIRLAAGRAVTNSPK